MLGAAPGTDAVTLAASSAGSYSTRLVLGDYELNYQVGTAGTLAPRNMLAALRCFAVR